MKRAFIIQFIFLLSILSIKAQISQGGLPPSLTKTSRLRSEAVIPTYEAKVDFDVNRLLWEDEMVDRSADGEGNRRFAIVIPVEGIGIAESGIWSVLDDSAKVWKQSIKAQDAQGLIINYTNFYIPKGGRLYLYNKDKSQILGAYTEMTNPRGGMFATEVVWGDEVTFEYVESTISDDQPIIEIQDIGYVYNLRSLARSNPGFNASDECMININCSDGAQVQLQKRGVVMLMVKQLSGYYEYCSGSLINNTLQDRKPYLLTASHCFRQGASVPEQSIFYFNFEFSGCANSNDYPSTVKTQVGAEVLVKNPLDKSADGTLVYLTNNIPEEWNPFFNGWDIRNNPAQRGVVIHHPFGDVKKIVTYSKSLVSGNVTIGSETGASNAYWRVQYDGRSVTQGGSSGAPLFNEYGLIVGTLTGGSSYCTNLTGADYYGKLWYNWNQDTVSEDYENDMSKYLDPNNSGVKALAGFGIIDGVEYTFDITKPTIDNPTTGGDDPTTGIDDEDKWSNDLKDFVLFPNPVQDQLNINTNSIMKNIRIYDLTGKSIYQMTNYNASTITIPMLDLNSGVYSIIVESESGKVYKEKFIKK